MRYQYHFCLQLLGVDDEMDEVGCRSSFNRKNQSEEKSLIDRKARCVARMPMSMHCPATAVFLQKTTSRNWCTVAACVQSLVGGARQDPTVLHRGVGRATPGGRAAVLRQPSHGGNECGLRSPPHTTTHTVW